MDMACTPGGSLAPRDRDRTPSYYYYSYYIIPPPVYCSIPWTIPTRFFAKSIAETDLPLHPGVPAGMPELAWNRGLGHNALDSYADANEHPLHPNVTFPDDLVRAMRRGYRAAVTYLDWMVGNVLDALDASGLAESTLTVFMGVLQHPGPTSPPSDRGQSADNVGRTEVALMLTHH